MVIKERIFLDPLEFPPGNSVPGWVMGSKDNLGTLEKELSCKLMLVGKGTLVKPFETPHILVECDTIDTLRKIDQTVRTWIQDANQRYREGGVFLQPETIEGLLFNLHIVLHKHPLMRVGDLELNYRKHFGHPLEWLRFAKIDDIQPNLEKYPHIVEVSQIPGETGMVVKSVLSLMANHAHVWQTHRTAKERKKEAKRKRDTSTPSKHTLINVKMSIHKMLKQVAAVNPMPASMLEKEFRDFWHIPIDARALGDTSMLSFVRKYPRVFNVNETDFLEPVVSAVEGVEPKDFVDDAQPVDARLQKPLRQKSADALVGMLVAVVAEKTVDKRFCVMQTVRTLADHVGRSIKPQQMGKLLDKVSNPPPIDKFPKEQRPAKQQKRR